MNTAAAPDRGRSALERVPAWLRSPKLLVPLAIAAMLVLLFSFASVVQDIVHQGEVGNGAVNTTSSVDSPRVDRA
ncbi:MAG: hypothetical protein ABW067_11420 [Rhizobacter sp.]|jgi:hypothetical protein